MPPQKSSFLQALGLSPDLTDEACTHAVSELVSLAVAEQSHPTSLKDIHEAASRYECAAYLEPLDVLPMLLPCPLDGAMDLMHLCALNNSPKEVMLVVQEAIERVQTRLNRDDDQEDVDSGLVQTVVGIVFLCSPAIARSRLGKRSAVELCVPVLEDLASLITSASSFGTREQGRAIIAQVARLVQSLSVWASAIVDDNALQEIKSLLRQLLDTTIVSCTPLIQASLAIRAAETCLPRFFVKSSAKDEWKGGAAAMLQVQLALEKLGSSPQTIYLKPSSLSDLVYLAHSTPPLVLSPFASSDLCRLLVNALQMNVVTDESLFLLLRILTHDDMSMSPEVAMSLCEVHTAMASTHLDPAIRQLNLRLLSLTLSKLPPPPRLETLLKLSADQDFPQIRGPAVGLIKEAVMEALALPPSHSHQNPFASPELLRVFGSVLFRPNPPEFFGERKTREELAQSLELLRIADCLAFYYVLLQRDHDNKTGIRRKDNVGSVQSSLLRPLRRFVVDHIAKEERPLMAVLSLQVGLDRIDSALQMLDLDRDTH